MGYYYNIVVLTDLNETILTLILIFKNLYLHQLMSTVDYN